MLWHRQIPPESWGLEFDLKQECAQNIDQCLPADFAIALHSEASSSSRRRRHVLEVIVAVVPVRDLVPVACIVSKLSRGSSSSSCWDCLFGFSLCGVCEVSARAPDFC